MSARWRCFVCNRTNVGVEPCACGGGVGSPFATRVVESPTANQLATEEPRVTSLLPARELTAVAENGESPSVEPAWLCECARLNRGGETCACGVASPFADMPIGPERWNDEKSTVASLRRVLEVYAAENESLAEENLRLLNANEFYHRRGKVA